MRIFCIGRNYAAHIKELGNSPTAEPVIFTKPDTALILKGKPFYLPDFSRDVQYELELVLRISGNVRHIEPRFAHRYVDAYTLGIDFTARDLQDKLKFNGLPWDLAKGFDGSAPLGTWIQGNPLNMDKPLKFELRKNGKTVQEGDTSFMIFSMDRLISYLSGFFTLRKGDIIFTGTPAGVGPVQKEDVLEGYLNGEPCLKCPVR